ncbi:HAD family hydrolase [Sinomonas sp. G460-2]|uniref:HAD family hydrolase n=1 Tax=Sinomonas sp. G460-2 TaxID=3393464 RepID=UPI0039EF47BE
MTESSPTRPGVIWCDFGGVLTPPVDEAARAIAIAAGVPWDLLWSAAKAVAEEVGLTGLQPLELGLMSQREWGSRIEARLPHGYRPRVALGHWGDYWYRDRPVDLDLLTELGQLKAYGTRLGMLTNSVAEWEVHRQRLLGDRAGIFECIVRSHEIGIAKPDPRIFAYADGSLSPGTAPPLLIDDSADNCAAASRAGWMVHHHRNREETLALLRSLRG